MAGQRRYFGTDGIRGRANEFPMTADVALRVGQVAGQVLRSNSANRRPRAIIGKDTRQSCYMLENALTAGLISVGMDVLLCGPVPTPAVAMLTKSMRCDVGVMISASHNPADDNGIKLFGGDGYKLSDEVQHEIEQALEDNNPELACAGNVGKASRLDDAAGRYIEFVKSSMPRATSLKGLKIVVDCAHGSAYHIAPKLLWELGAEVVALGVQPNGQNINDGVGSTHTSAMCEAIIAHKADAGLALDGDADRVILADEQGRCVDGDQILAIMALQLKAQKRLHGDVVVTTHMSNMGLEGFLKRHDIAMTRTNVGDRYVVEAMREGGYGLGGEQSGHIIVGDAVTTGDGLMAGLHMLVAMQEQATVASEAWHAFEPFPQRLENVRFEGVSPLTHPDFVAAIDEANKQLGDEGRVFVRPSGTEPLLRIMVEGNDAGAVDALVERLVKQTYNYTENAA